ncbi:MAG: hypothetical protein IIV87_05410 [Oscillospiraceae bacterium]|nr:hypothetical protein [Oscillospiraceae bacterium]
MANQMKNKKKTGAPVQDYTVTKVMAALLLLVASIFLLGRVGALYVSLDTIGMIHTPTRLAMFGYLALSIACIAVTVFVHKPIWKTVCGYALPVALLGLFTTFILTTFHDTRVTMLYFVNVAVYCLYVIYQLYGAEFALISLLTSFAGWTFYRFYPGIEFTLAQITCSVILPLLIVGAVVLAAKAAKNKGCISVRGKKQHIFHRGFQPLFVYVTCAIWAVCFIASLLLGDLFAYYCMFAAIAFELIAAVYFTFQLK